MKNSIRRVFALSAILAICSVVPVATPAAPTGLAWDAVVRFMPNADPSELQPGSFDDDYATASAVQTEQSGGGGLFGGLKHAMAMGKSMQDMMTNGMAQRRYVAGSKDRTDIVAMQTATITDCVARTITTLDLSRKTYRVVSMDQPSAPSSGGTSSHGYSAPRDDGTKVAISVVNSALGARAVDGRPTTGFRSDLRFTETKPSGESQTQNANLVAYYASLSNPDTSCRRGGAEGSAMAPGAGFAMMAAAAKMMGQLRAAGFDKRFSLSQSGPRLPFDRLAMYEAFTFGTQNAGHGFTVVTERGHIHWLDANDPIFSIPGDFTEER